MLSLFVCGTVSNARGFEYFLVEGDPLPGETERYMDRYNPEENDKTKSYKIARATINKKNYTIITSYEKVKPNDQRYFEIKHFT